MKEGLNSYEGLPDSNAHKRILPDCDPVQMLPQPTEEEALHEHLPNNWLNLRQTPATIAKAYCFKLAHGLLPSLWGWEALNAPLLRRWGGFRNIAY